MNLESAYKILNCELQKLSEKAECHLVVITDDTIQLEDGWLFFYNSAEFMHTGDPLDCLVGNGPIFVSSEGNVKILDSNRDWKEQI
ncbi:YrhB domain-containing protein [Pseudoalteromonas sp. PA2MD11]|uniref:YrhB domain-containing protein n=1 Tax=Pseudoalteromonas sp. PA2MD11 TaxID=2785057 RepID=UPI001AE014E8|nr:YrhB domain-containing protein [Pseudoalteromonas sp. PA2MD11]